MVERGVVMAYVTVGRENTGDIRIYYEDHGVGAPVVLVHGYLAEGIPGRSRRRPCSRDHRTHAAEINRALLGFLRAL